ncbi:hypothetical protein ACWEPC_35300 [Nonomuraea sp. NPDC004297]
MPPRRPLGAATPRRWTVVVLGLGIIVLALAGAAGPYRQTGAFREVVACEQRTGGCFDSEPGSVVKRRTYTTTSTTTHTDANGHTYTTSDTTIHYEVTWRRAGGAEESRDVSSGFYGGVAEGQAVTLRLWRGEVVGLRATGDAQWFEPAPSRSLRYWLLLAFLGLGVTLWGLLFGWWDGLFMLAFRTFSWMFLSFLPVNLVSTALTYGLTPGFGLVVQIAFCVFFAVIAGWMLLNTLGRR